MRKYVTGGLIVLLMILEYLLAFTVPGVLVALNIILAGAYLYFRFTRHPLADDPMVRGGGAVFALVLLLLLAYVLGFNAVPQEVKQDILRSPAQQRDQILNATSMMAKIAENQGKMVERNLQSLQSDPNPVLSLRIEDYDYTLYEPYDREFQDTVQEKILMPVAAPYMEKIGNLNAHDYPTTEDKLQLMQMLNTGNIIVKQHLAAISGFMFTVRVINMMMPLFLIYLLGMFILYIRGRSHEQRQTSLVRREAIQAFIWVAVLAVLLLASSGMSDNPFMGTAMMLLAMRLVVQVVFIIMALTGRTNVLTNPLVKALAQLLAVLFVFYALVSFVVVGPGGINEEMVTAMNKLSVFVYIFSACFALGIVIASLSKRVSGVFESAGFRAFWGAVSMVAKILLGVVIIAVFSSLGMFTDSPGTMVPVYFVFFLLVFAGVLVSTWMKHRGKSAGSNLARITRKVFGLALLVLCLIIPVWSMQGLFPGFFDKVTEHPQGELQVTNQAKKVILTWSLDDMTGIESFNIARGDGKEPDPGENPDRLNDYPVVLQNELFEVQDNNKISFERPYYYWVEELRADDAPIYRGLYTYIPVDTNVKVMEEVFEHHESGYIDITNDDLTVTLKYRTSDLGVTGVNFWRGDTPEALKATRVENEDGSWRTDVEADKSVVKLNGAEPLAPVRDDRLQFIDTEGLQYGWNYYWVIEAKYADGAQDVYAPVTYSPVNNDDPAVQTDALKTLSIRFNVGMAILLMLITAAVMVVGGLGVFIINKFKDNNLLLAILGYVVLIVVATVPALLMMQVDSSYSALGVAYYTAVFIALFSWWGVALFATKAQENASA